MERNFYDQTIDSDTKQFEEIRNLATGQGEDCTTGCFRLSAHQKLL